MYSFKKCCILGWKHTQKSIKRNLLLHFENWWETATLWNIELKKENCDLGGLGFGGSEKAAYESSER